VAQSCAGVNTSSPRRTPFKVFKTNTASASPGALAPAAMKLALDSSKSGEGTFEWSDAPKLPLERRLDAVARRMLEFAEQRLRANAQYQYEWTLERQAALRREIQEEQEAAERERLHRLAANLRKAREIRDLVALATRRFCRFSGDGKKKRWRKPTGWIRG
jgi:hypothetical protein